jgi:hypothetical protein
VKTVKNRVWFFKEYKNYSAHMLPEMLELIPKYKVDGEGYEKETWSYLNLNIKFQRQQIKDINESIGNRFK